MLKFNKLRFSLVLIFFISCQQLKEDKMKEYDILFIGNSHLIPIPDKLEGYINNKYKKFNIKVHKSIKGGATLKWHYEDKKKNFLLERLEKEKFDIVIIQESGSPTYNPEKIANMKYYMPKLIELIRSKGAKPILYCTHEYYNCAYNANQKDINDLYNYFGKKYKVPVIPVGPICKKIKDEKNLIIHNIPDVIHANKFGVELYINIFYYFLTDECIDENFKWTSVEVAHPNKESLPKYGNLFNKTERESFNKQKKSPQIISKEQSKYIFNVIKNMVQEYKNK